ncbi:MAG TPA: TonB-dependent receptor plug domain-containing protein [Opitutaceae bacterium]|nr:TonB-dependent receptor plug domain-containing protein [Opitutaceae bacterium]
MTYKHASAGSILAALLAVAAPRLAAQAAPSAPPAGNSEDETIELSPFVIQAAEDPDSYAAKATLAGTRIRTDLKDVGSAIQVVTAKFLQDTGSTSSQDLLVYTTSTEVGGQSGNFVGAGNGQSINTRNQRSSPQTNTRVRGLAEADNTRDFFLTDIPWDSYNVGRVDLQRGPNSILFGIGSPAGIVNSSLNTASFKDENKIEFRIGSFGSTRESADFNKVILKNELAVRISALNDETKFQQDPAFAHDKRAYGALRYEPGFLKINGMNTQIRANFETGNVVANRPRITPPVDAITPWFTAMNKQVYDARNLGKNAPDQVNPGGANYSPDNGAVFSTDSKGGPNPNFQPWLGAYGGAIFDEPVAVFGDPKSSNLDYWFTGSQNTKNPAPPASVIIPWSVSKGIVAYHDYAGQAKLQNYELGVYKDQTLSDPSIFDFYNKLIDGPNKQELQNFHSYNIALNQTFFNNKLGFEAAFDRQSYKQEDDALIGNPYLTVEVQSVLPDGRPNPNVGRALVVGSAGNNADKFSDRRSLRLTGFGELNFKDFLGNSLLTSILGRHVFTGLYQTQEHNQEQKSWYSYATDQLWRPDAQTVNSRRLESVNYLGGDLRGMSSASGANLPGLEARQSLYSGTIRDFSGAVATNRPVSDPPNLYDLVGWVDKPFRVLDGYNGTNRDDLIATNSAVKFQDKVKSYAAIWQGYFWDETIVPTFGYRKDKSLSRNAGHSPQFQDGSQVDDYKNPNWKLPNSADDEGVGSNGVTYNDESGISRSWSVVVHTPKFIKEKLPYGTDISVFYNRSDNFQPAGGRTDIFGASLASPTGKTRDMGITISTLNDRIAFKINWYKTEVKNASLDGGGTGNLVSVYRLGANESWGYSFAKWAEGGIETFKSNYALENPDDPASARIDPNIAVLRYQPQPGQSIADALAAQNAAIAAFTDPKNLPPAAFDSAWGFNNRATIDYTKGWAGGLLNWSQPSSLAITGDTESKGTEYELTAQPTPGWNITINAAKTTASRLNIASSLAEWVDARNTFYQGPAGDVRMWNGSLGGTQTVRQVWNTEFYASYLLYRLQENADVPELRPWRINAITNYDFRDGVLKGVNIGGAWRWQDGIIVGYPVKNGFFDLENPWKGPAETSIDLWVGYERKLTRRYTWRTQLNVRNVFADKDLIPITVQPDGSPATSRIPEPRVITWTNTLKF